MSVTALIKKRRHRTQDHMRIDQTDSHYPYDICPNENLWSRIQVAPVQGVSLLNTCQSINPLKIFNPHDGGTTCHVVLSSYGGGFVTGDQIYFQVVCQPDSKLFLGTQAETKVYKSVYDQTSSQTIVGSLGKNALAVIAPDALIPYAGSRFVQKQIWTLETTSCLILIDWIHSGRSALGEDFQYDLLRSDIEIFVDGEKVILDRLKIQPGYSSPFAPGAYGEYTSCFNMYLVGDACAPLIQKINNVIKKGGAIPGYNEQKFCLPNDNAREEYFKGIWLGLNRMNDTCYVLRLLAREKQDIEPLLKIFFAELASKKLLGFNPLTRKL
ncbi:urease accessory protein UreD [PVC group bacterium]|nr:urease accessory protein UreD [PVC group bacterium]